MKHLSTLILATSVLAACSLAAQRPPGGRGKLQKPDMSDTIKVNVYADNWFAMYINGKLVATDSIDFMPHNVVSVDILPEYPMTIAIIAKDNADPKTGLEYGDKIGDGGIIVKMGDGTVTSARWKAKSFFRGPINGDTRSPKVKHEPIPSNWYTVNFNDSAWRPAREFSEREIRPMEAFRTADFSGARFIWSDNLELDNTIIFRTRIDKPGWRPRWNTKPDLDISEAPKK